MATTSIEKELLGLEREYWDAMVHKNPEPPSRLTADECLVVGPPGISKVKGTDIAGMVTKDQNKIKIERDSRFFHGLQSILSIHIDFSKSSLLYCLIQDPLEGDSEVGSIQLGKHVFNVPVKQE